MLEKEDKSNTRRTDLKKQEIFEGAWALIARIDKYIAENIIIKHTIK